MCVYAPSQHSFILCTGTNTGNIAMLAYGAYTTMVSPL